ncbi:MAG: hypothetical protein V3T56_07025 [Gemmatimonadales bacterium]
MWQDPIFVTGLVIPLAGMATGIILGYPVVKAVVRAFENRAGRRGSGEDKLEPAMTELRERLDALEDRVDHRLAEVEERMDFAERLLTKHRDQSALPGDR